MARRRKSKEKSGGGGAPLWMTTFSDMMSLLLTFFILLFSMSSINEEKFSQASQSIQTALLSGSSMSILDGEGTGEVEEVEEAAIEEEASENLPEEVVEIYAEVQAFVKENELESKVSLSRDEKGIYVDINESILFDSGKANVKENGEKTLELVAELLSKFQNPIVIEGYTDDVPTGNTSKYPSNWELSVDRAVSVVRYLSEEKTLDASRLSAVGFGEHKPVAPNDSPTNKARNRRVNIVIVHEPKDVN